jgi:hypothetical protein
MKQIDFYKEGTELLYVKRDILENKVIQILILILIFIVSELNVLLWGGNTVIKIIMNTICIICCIVIVFSLFTEKYRPKKSKYSLYIINQNFIYERVTPEKEGFNSDNEIVKFEIVKFIDEKGSLIKIISNKELPWEKRKVHIAKEYLPYKQQIIKHLNKNYTMSKMESETSFLLKKHFT